MEPAEAGSAARTLRDPDSRADSRVHLTRSHCRHPFPWRPSRRQHQISSPSREKKHTDNRARQFADQSEPARSGFGPSLPATDVFRLACKNPRRLTRIWYIGSFLGASAIRRRLPGDSRAPVAPPRDARRPSYSLLCPSPARPPDSGGAPDNDSAESRNPQTDACTLLRAVTGGLWAEELRPAGVYAAPGCVGGGRGAGWRRGGEQTRCQ